MPMHSFPYTPSVPSNAELIKIVMPFIQLLWGDLLAAPLVVQVRCEVLLQDLDDLPSVNIFKVFPLSASGAG